MQAEFLGVPISVEADQQATSGSTQQNGDK
jgi:hypothetical protein